MTEEGERAEQGVGRGWSGGVGGVLGRERESSSSSNNSSTIEQLPYTIASPTRTHTHTHTETRERDRQKQRQRQTDKDRDRERDRQRHRQTDRERTAPSVEQQTVPCAVPKPDPTENTDRPARATLKTPRPHYPQAYLSRHL